MQNLSSQQPNLCNPSCVQVGQLQLTVDYSSIESYVTLLCHGMYVVCYLRQCPALNAVCINWGRFWVKSGLYVYVLEAAKLPCVLITVL